MKKVISLLVLLFISSTVFCQTFMHGAGVTILVGSSKGGNVSVSKGFTYFPRINLLETEALSVSAGIPLSIGISGSYSETYSSSGGYYSNPGTIGFMVNAPFIINLNIGRGSTKENTDKFGYFVGAGIGYHHGDFIILATDSYGSDYTATESINFVGPAANAGVRIGVGSVHRNIEIRLSYMKEVNKNKVNLFGIACAFNF